jgi:hypothetical protein
MTQVELRYVKPERDRDGRVRYWYFRRNGRRWRLPGEPMSPEFMAEYHRLLAATGPARPGNREQGPGSFGALVTDYLASPESRKRRPSTQKMYRFVLEPLAEIHGHKPVARLERRHIKAWRDARSETPGVANMIVKVTHTRSRRSIGPTTRPSRLRPSISASTGLGRTMSVLLSRHDGRPAVCSGGPICSPSLPGSAAATLRI